MSKKQDESIRRTGIATEWAKIISTDIAERIRQAAEVRITAAVSGTLGGLPPYMSKYRQFLMGPIMQAANEVIADAVMDHVRKPIYERAVTVMEGQPDDDTILDLFDAVQQWAEAEYLPDTPDTGDLFLKDDDNPA